MPPGAGIRGDVKKTSDYFSKGNQPVTSRDFDQSFDPINAGSSGNPSSYTARAGDTLQAVASSVWGDASLWYLLADANDLSGAETLQAGQRLVIPGRPTNIHNNADTVRPYNPAELMGSIGPRLPKPRQNECAAFVSVVVQAVVTAVVTAYAGPVAGAAAGDAARQYSYAAATGELDWADLLTPGSIGRMIDPTSDASLAERLHHPPGFTKDMEYKYSDTATAAAVAYVMQPAGASGSGTGATSAAAAGSAGATAGAVDWSQVMAMGALRGAEATALNLALHGEWSWREITAGALGGAASAGVTANMGAGPVSSFIGSAASGMVRNEYLAHTQDGYTRTSTGMLFAQALGAGIQEAINPASGGSSGPNRLEQWAGDGWDWVTGAGSGVSKMPSERVGNALGHQASYGLDDPTQPLDGGGDLPVANSPLPIDPRTGRPSFRSPVPATAADPFAAPSGSPALDLGDPAAELWLVSKAANRNHVRTITVQDGDTLERLAGNSDPQYLDRLAAYNNLTDRHN